MYQGYYRQLNRASSVMRSPSWSASPKQIPAGVLPRIRKTHRRRGQLRIQPTGILPTLIVQRIKSWISSSPVWSPWLTATLQPLPPFSRLKAFSPFVAIARTPINVPAKGHQKGEGLRLGMPLTRPQRDFVAPGGASSLGQGVPSLEWEGDLVLSLVLIPGKKRAPRGVSFCFGKEGKTSWVLVQQDTWVDLVHISCL